MSKITCEHCGQRVERGGHFVCNGKGVTAGGMSAGNGKTHNHALIVDSYPAPEDACCYIDHAGSGADFYSAELTLLLSAADGLREVHMCGDANHGAMSGTDLLPWSQSVDEAQRELEGEIEDIEMENFFSRCRAEAA